MKHVCGFTSILGDTCEVCEFNRSLWSVDPNDKLVDTESTNNGEIRSSTMSEEEYEYEEEMNWDDEGYTVVNFLADLEQFLESKLDDVTRGNVFLSENKNGVTVNMLIGTPFADSDQEINQINVIIAPTDRKFLGSEGVSIGAEDNPDEEGNVFFDTREQAREYARTTNSKVVDNGPDASGVRWSVHEAFDNAMKHVNGE